MIERIIVPVDGSTLSEQAIPFGSLLARTFSCPIEIVHVIELPMYVTIADPAATVSPDAVTAYLTSLTERLPLGMQARTVVVDGRPARELLALANETSGSMIVMATHGRGGLPRALLGSVADKVVRGSSVPVGLVRAADLPLPLPDKLTRIAIPLDGSELSEEALRVGIDLANRTGATLLLVRVIEPIVVSPPSCDMYGAMSMDPHMVEEIITELKEDARASLSTWADTISDDGIPVEWVMSEGRPITEILRHAVEHRADLIMTTTHGRGGLSRIFLGSVATGLINHSPLPLIVIPARAAGQPDDADG
jgi:nucleotide-binding universal stress UspA family protein